MRHRLIQYDKKFSAALSALNPGKENFLAWPGLHSFFLAVGAFDAMCIKSKVNNRHGRTPVGAIGGTPTLLFNLQNTLHDRRLDTGLFNRRYRT